MIFNNKKILITGHTGFKGSWLSVWLNSMGANVIGVSKDVPTKLSHYDSIKNVFFEDYRSDIIEKDFIFDVIERNKPEFIFHLAAQPIVLDSFKDPLNTFKTNFLGTINLLDSLKKVNHKSIAVIITSDKAYDNVEWTYGYRETDRLGGKDPYSASKGSAELAIRSYVDSFFRQKESNVTIGIGRAGNVIGGGDWAPFRIVPDCIKAWAIKNKPVIRNSKATRPWQHVLEPLSGYLTLAYQFYNNEEKNGEAFNFGPPADQNFTVGDLVNEMSKNWEETQWIDKSDENSSMEAGLLKLNCDKALHELNWKATLNFKETAEWTIDWYKNYYLNNKKNVLDFTKNQIDSYIKLAKIRNTTPLF